MKQRAAAMRASLPAIAPVANERSRVSFALSEMDALKKHLWGTIHSNKMSVESIAFELGVSPSYLYRAALPGQSGCRFPLDLLLNLMRVTGDYRVLEFVAGEANRCLITMRQVRKVKAGDAAFINAMTRTFNEAMAGLLECFETPAYPAEDLLALLYKHLCDVAAMRRAVASRRQRELF
jgi:hypothetical protein